MPAPCVRRAHRDPLVRRARARGAAARVGVLARDRARAGRAADRASLARRCERDRAAQVPELAGTEVAARNRLLLLGVTESAIDSILAAGRASRTIAVRAPISGHVTRFEAVVGTYATPELLLYEITDLSQVRVVASMGTEGIHGLAPGASIGGSSRTPAGAELVLRSGARVPLRLELIEPALASETRSLRARFVAVNAEYALRPGDIGDVVVARAPIDAVTVPRDAVIDDGTRRYVFVEVERGLFEPREVVVGALLGDRRVVTRGIAAGEVVVARGTFVLDSESRLESALAPSAPSASPATAPAGPNGGAP